MAGQRNRLSLLASTSLGALLLGGAPSAYAACFTGPFPTANAGTVSCIRVNNTSFTGNVSNTGTIAPGPTGIAVVNNSTITGRIIDSGTIAASVHGILIDDTSEILGADAITVTGATFSGGISNAGTISAGGTGAIFIEAVTSFSGGVSNSGTISATEYGILSHEVSTFSGGISNSGTIESAAESAILVQNSESFSGGITNSGLLSAHVVGINVLADTTVTGGIGNTGTISAAQTGIALDVAIFTGGISNGGTIATNEYGILATGDTAFSGGILNTGTISAGESGIRVLGFISFLGGISNTGTISANGSAGIFVHDTTTFAGGISNSAAIFAHGPGVTVQNVTTLAGGIENSGTIAAGSEGIYIYRVTNFSGGISNSGTISSGLSGAGYGVAAVDFLNFSGGISNSGTISARGATGIYVSLTTLPQFAAASFGGGITNSGTITAAIGINVSLIGSFSGGIDNSGTISGGSGIALSHAGAISGGITNSGTISVAGGEGVFIFDITTFSGGITNAGRIVSSDDGMLIEEGATFSGGITNSGTISQTGANSAFGGIVVGGLLGLPLALSSFSGGISSSGTIVADGQGILVGGVGTGSSLVVSNFSGGISNGGAITALTGNGIVVGGRIGNAETITISTFTGGIANSGVIVAAGNGILVGGTTTGTGVIAISTFAGGVTNAGTISAGNAGILVGKVSVFTGNISNAGTITAETGIRVTSNVGFAAGGAVVNSGTIVGTVAAIDTTDATSPVTIDQTAGLISGAIKLSANADVLNVSGGTITGNIVGQGTSDTINFNLGAGTFIYASPYSFGTVNQVNVNSGTIILDGTNQATNTTVTGGTLEIGDAAHPGATLQTNTVAVNGGTLAGYGTIDPAPVTTVTIASGATLAPGAPGGSIGTLTIAGDLAITSGSFYDVAVNDTTASKTLVNAASGTATINGGTVVVTPQYTTLGTHGGTTFTILTATDGRSGTFAGLTVNNSSFIGSFSLSYDADDVFLNVGKGFEILPTPVGATVNEENVVNGINNAILAGNTVPGAFNQLLGLSGAAYLNALNQLDGEDATGAERGAFDLMNEFLGLVLDPFVAGRGGGDGGALGFAPDQQAGLPPDMALAYAGVLKAPPQQTFAQRWSTWAAGFGGSATTNGDPTVGSSNVTTSTYGYAAGLDYHYSPDTVFGFSLAGGGANWNLADALGSGRSDAFLAGIYGVTHNGPWYLGGALAFANNWFTTNRTALGDQLTASFQGQSYAARLEAGYRFAVPVTHGAVGVIPYAAIQAQDFHTPAYSETDLTGGGFGLAYNAMDGMDTRSEFGGRFDDLTALNSMPLVLRAKVAWAHDWVSNPALNTSFESLAGASFTVNGAPIPQDSALISASAQLFFTPNWSFLAKFDGEFADGSQLYAGSGTLRHTW